MNARSISGFGKPPASLAGFPDTPMPPIAYRAHDATLGPWWFASDGGGRFDLTTGGRGTCYLADDPWAAFRERLGPTLAALPVVRAADVARAAISTLRVPGSRTLADTTTRAAQRFAVTREIHTTLDYALTQRWAARFDADGWDGIRYQPRLSTDSGSFAYAVFDRAGSKGWPVAAVETAAELARREALIVEPDPTLAQVNIIQPPA